jgi:hypothetical protein
LSSLLFRLSLPLSLCIGGGGVRSQLSLVQLTFASLSLYRGGG